MSGGSHNYLYMAERLYGRIEDLAVMANRLGELGFDDAAKETASIMADIIKFDAEITKRQTKMDGIWEAVEMYDSLDWGIDDVKEAIEQYRNEQDRKL